MTVVLVRPAVAALGKALSMFARSGARAEPAGVPALTHQTAADANLSAEQTRWRERLIALNPGWEHRFYTDADGRDLLRCDAPGLLEVYDSYPTAIQRTDMFRVVAVYLQGGVYADLDMNLLAPLAPLTRLRLALAEEKTLSAEEAARLGHPERLRIANYMFGSVAGHPFWLDVLEEMVARADRPVLTDHDILESTGPGLISSVYGRVGRAYDDISVLPNPGALCPSCGEPSCQFGRFAQHLHRGSWRGRRSEDGKPPADPAVAQRTIRLWRRTQEPAPGIDVLQCYSGPAADGLSSVQSLVNPIGRVVADSKGLTGRTVLVPGIPFLHEDRLSPANRNIVYTTFETSVLPGHWVEAINRSYHGVIVPHDHVRDVFAASGVEKPIFVVGQAFSRPPPSRAAPGGSPRIGFLGTPVRRKNLEALYRACRMLLPRWPDLKLAVHVSVWYDWLARDEGDHVRRDPMVEWTEGRMDARALSDWRGGLTCYAYPSRAEGWSFTPRESLFLGVPTVISDIPLHEDLVRSGYCHVVPARGRESARYEGGVFGEWTRIEAEDIAAVLEEVLSAPDDARRRAQEGAKWIESRFLVTDAQAELIRILDAFHENSLSSRLSDQGERAGGNAG
jgi:glycosyltransferase involved in cell wall biosynthesis